MNVELKDLSTDKKLKEETQVSRINKKLSINSICFVNKEEIKKISAKFGSNDHNITVFRTSTVVDYDKDRNKVEKRIREPINLTRKVNETAKLIKQDIASSKLAQIQKVLDKYK